MVVSTKEEAMEWFLSNSSGSIICKNKKGEEKECFSYPEACCFLDEHVQKKKCAHVFEKRKVDDDIVRICIKCGIEPHEDGDYSYLCGREYCRCSQ